MKKYFLIEFTSQYMDWNDAGMISSANYYAEDELEAIDEFRADFGSAPVIEYCEEAFAPLV